MAIINFVTLGTARTRPTWLYSVGLESGQRFWFPAVVANPGDPIRFVKRKSSYFAVRLVEIQICDMAMSDGVQVIEHLGHAFLPVNWILSVNPDAKEFCQAAVSRFQMPASRISHSLGT